MLQGVIIMLEMCYFVVAYVISKCHIHLLFYVAYVAIHFVDVILRWNGDLLYTYNVLLHELTKMLEDF